MANVISLPIFTQLLEPAGIAPAQDFASSRELVCDRLPDSQQLSLIHI